MLRGKQTEKVLQYGHERLSTFGIGADLPEAQWRAVLRQLIALGYLRVEGEFSTLELTESARPVLRGEVQLRLRHAARPAGKTRRTSLDSSGKRKRSPLSMDDEELAHFEALKAWRAGIAREHNIPAYIVFNDATLAEMAKEVPDTLAALAEISGVGAKKLEAYGRDILRVLNG